MSELKFETASRIVLFLMWPLLAPFMVALLVIMFVVAWPLILFGKLTKSEAGHE